MDTIRLLTARIDRVQQVSQDAKIAAQAAAAAGRTAAHELLTLQKQNVQLRDRIKNLEGRQKVCPLRPPAASMHLHSSFFRIVWHIL